jgi:E3 ubiquitin-protein ligase MARCH6
MAARFLKKTLTLMFVAFCWIGLVPLIASRTHQVVFNGLISSIFSARILTIFSLENAGIDVMRGWVIMTLFVCTFIALVWLREQVNIGVVQDVNVAQAQPPQQRPDANPELAQRARQELQGGLRALLLDEDQADEPNAEANPNQDAEQQVDQANQRQEAEQFPENMTWQRLLGLDGSFAFIENVFWVISLNFGFHVIFCKFI